MKLYEIKESYQQLLELEDVDMSEYIESIQDQAEEQIIQLGRFIKQLEAESEAIKNEEKKLSNRRSTLDNKVEYFKNYILTTMITMKIETVKDATVVVKPKMNPASVVIDNDELIPNEYKNIIPESFSVDKKLIKDAIKNGADIPGVHLEQKQSISIK